MIKYDQMDLTIVFKMFSKFSKFWLDLYLFACFILFYLIHLSLKVLHLQIL